MAVLSRKDKHLDNAQKFLFKGQLDRAIKEYEQAVALEPKDFRVRQKFAELLVRAARKDEALREFATIGTYYADNGFVLKAIAVYKQVQKIDPANLDISLTLASLNQRQGLVGNALAEYKSIYDFYEKKGQFAEAVSVLEKMQATDPENLNIRLKLAETRLKAGTADEAYLEFSEIAQEVRRRGDTAAFGRICERIATLFPERKDFLLGVAEREVNAGRPLAALPLLRQLADDDRFNPKALSLLAEAGMAAGDAKSAQTAYARLIQRFPQVGGSKSGLVSSLVAGGQLDEAARYLGRFEAELLANEAGSVEQLYCAILERAPELDVARQGLQRVHAAMGRTEPTVAAADDAPQVPVHPEGEQSPPHGVVSAEGSGETLEPDDLPWEEEIDISFEDDTTGDEVGDTEDGSPVDEDPEALICAVSERDDFLAAADESGATADAAALSLSAPEGSLPADDAGLEQIEVEIADCSFTDDQWLNNASIGIPTEFERSGETEVLDLDFSDGELDDLIPAPPVSLQVVKHDKYGLDGFFSAFKKGVGEQIDQGDTESHYNLGIAYREMGLFDDAISEFRAASLDLRRRADCVVLQGICYRDKGDFAKAEAVFTSGLELTGLSDEERLYLQYELALLHEACGENERAAELYADIARKDPQFRDAARKFEALDGEEAGFEGLELLELKG